MDSTGKVYVFDYEFGFNATGAAPGQIEMTTSTTAERTSAVR